MSLKSLGVLKLEPGEASETTTGESTGRSGGGIGEGIVSVEEVGKFGSEGESTGSAEAGSSTGGDDWVKESAETWDESAGMVPSATLGTGEIGSIDAKDEAAETSETSSGTGAGLSVGRADMVESGSFDSTETGSCESGAGEVTG